jgi:hypothetical protein
MKVKGEKRENKKPVESRGTSREIKSGKNREVKLPKKSEAITS